MKVTKKIIKHTCWVCEGKGCKVCNKKGYREDTMYYFIVKDKNGKQYCYNSDTLA